jgi:hypothetical protein
MMIQRWLILLGLAVLVCLGCSGENSPVGPDTIIGSGVLDSEVRSLDPLHSVSMRMPGDVALTYGDNQTLTVIADDNVLEYIETIDSSGTLIIRVQSGISLSNFELTVNVTMTDLEGVESLSTGFITSTNRFEVNSVGVILSGSGPVSLELTTRALSSILSGVGPLTLEGIADVHAIVLSGTGTVAAFELETVNTSVILSGTGSAQIRVSTALSVILSGTGSVLYKGNPGQKTEIITGTGSVIPVT